MSEASEHQKPKFSWNQKLDNQVYRDQRQTQQRKFKLFILKQWKRTHSLWSKRKIQSRKILRGTVTIQLDIVLR